MTGDGDGILVLAAPDVLAPSWSISPWNIEGLNSVTKGAVEPLAEVGPLLGKLFAVSFN